MPGGGCVWWWVWLVRCFSCSAYQANDIADFERILRENQKTIMEDPFIREHVEGAWAGWGGWGSGCFHHWQLSSCRFTAEHPHASPHPADPALHSHQDPYHCQGRHGCGVGGAGCTKPWWSRVLWTALRCTCPPSLLCCLQELNISQEEVEELLVTSILDK